MLTTENHKWFKVVSIKISFEDVDSWAKSLLFRTHHLWNATTELTLLLMRPHLNQMWVPFSFKIYFDHCLHKCPRNVFDFEPVGVKNADIFNWLANADIWFWFSNFSDVQIIKLFSELLQKVFSIWQKTNFLKSFCQLIPLAFFGS